MATRYDDWARFHNPTNEDFIGRWDMEDYFIPAGATKVYPVWLAKHFAKRLCDRAMNLEYGNPLRLDDQRRQVVMKLCLPELDLTLDIQETKSTKAQIERDSEQVDMTLEKKVQLLEGQLKEARNRLNKTTGSVIPSPDETAPSVPDEEPTDEEDDDDGADAPLEAAPETEEAIANEVAQEYDEMGKAFKAGKRGTIKHAIGKRQNIAKPRAKAPARGVGFEGNVEKTDTSLQKSFEQTLSADGPQE